MLSVIVCSLVFFAVVGVDQLTKALTDGAETITVIKDILYLEGTYNTGAAFSLFGGEEWAQTFFIILTVVAVIGATAYLFLNKKKSLWLDLSIVLVLAGAIGNFIDRAIFGYVRDFIYVTFFANFNVADAAITIGAIMLIVFFLFLDKEAIIRFKKKNENK